MYPNEYSEFHIKSELGYGETSPNEKIPPNSNLNFKIKLL